MLALARSGILQPGQVRPCLPKQLAVSNGLIGYWGFDADCLDFSNNIALDLGPNGLTGNFVGTPVLANGKIAQSLSFDGTTNKVTLGTPAILNITGPLTIAVWINPTSSGGGGSGRIFNKLGAGGYSFGMNASATSLKFNAGSAAPFTGSVLISGAFNHAVVTLSAAAAQIYVNGVVQGSTAGSSPADSSATGACIAGQAVDNTRNFAGTIDDVRIYNRALDPWEVIQLYQTGLAGRRDAGNRLFPISDVMAVGLPGSPGEIPHHKYFLADIGSLMGR